jgi:hypothetical protein
MVHKLQGDQHRLAVCTEPDLATPNELVMVNGGILHVSTTPERTVDHGRALAYVDITRTELSLAALADENSLQRAGSITRTADGRIATCTHRLYGMHMRPNDVGLEHTAGLNIARLPEWHDHHIRGAVKVRPAPVQNDTERTDGA